MNGPAIPSSSPWIEAIGWMLLHSLWQGAGVAMVLAFMLCVLRRAPARMRYLAACAAMILLVALPIATLFRGNVPHPSPSIHHDAVAEPAIVGVHRPRWPFRFENTDSRRPARADVAGDRGALDGRGRSLLATAPGRLDPGPAMGAASHPTARRSLARAGRAAQGAAGRPPRRGAARIGAGRGADGRRLVAARDPRAGRGPLGPLRARARGDPGARAGPHPPA